MCWRFGLLLGRIFRPDEVDRPGSEPVAIISYDFWQRHFHGDEDAIGRELKINSRTLTVIGVTPAGFRGGMNSLGFDVWIPATMATELQPATKELSSRTSRPVFDAHAAQARRDARAGAGGT